MRLLDVALGHLLGDHVAVNLDVLLQLAVGNPPLAGDLERADGRLRVNERVDTAGDVGEGKLVGGLLNGQRLSRSHANTAMYLANGLLVGDVVGGLGGRVARVELVGDEGRAEGLDHEVVVVESVDDLLLADAGGQGSGNAGGGHFGGGIGDVEILFS